MANVRFSLTAPVFTPNATCLILILGAMKHRLGRPTVIAVFFLLEFVIGTRSFASVDRLNIVPMMEAAYAGVTDYRAEMEVREFGNGSRCKIEKFLYTFKKPNLIRIDLHTPYPGTVLVYPDENGKVVVRRPGFPHRLALHLSPESHLLRSNGGQRIDQTDLGSLIANIGKSLSESLYPAAVEENQHIRIELLGPDHFRGGVTTFYSFWIDKKLMLPVRVMESTPEGILRRTVVFRDLKVNTGVTLETFRLDRPAA